MPAPRGPGRSPEAERFERARGMIDILARRIKKRYPSIAFDDLVGAGSEAATLASRNYDAKLGIPFEMFALKRIRGAMLRLTHGETYDRVKVAVRMAVNERLGDYDMSPPAHVPLEVALEDTPEKVRARAVDWLRQQSAALMATALLHQHEHSLEADAEAAIAARDAYRHGHERLAALLAKLPEDEKLFFQRYYREEKTLDDVATELGCSARSARRLHASLKAKLASGLRRAGVTEEPPIEGRTG